MRRSLSSERLSPFEDMVGAAVTDVDWSTANCNTIGAGVDMFPTDSAGVARALRVCEGCHLRSECEDLGAHEDYGVFGSSVRERQRRRGLSRQGNRSQPAQPTPRGTT